MMENPCNSFIYHGTDSLHVLMSRDANKSPLNLLTEAVCAINVVQAYRRINKSSASATDWIGFISRGFL